MTEMHRSFLPSEIFLTDPPEIHGATPHVGALLSKALTCNANSNHPSQGLHH